MEDFLKHSSSSESPEVSRQVFEGIINVSIYVWNCAVLSDEVA